MKHHVAFDLEFKKNTYGGLYVSLEGIDGSGKTTHVNQLIQTLQSQGKDVLQTKEPAREGPTGELINKILQDTIEFPRVALQYLFAADRTVHLETVVIPALKEGKIVVSDRSFWSSIPYGLADVNKYQGDIDLAAFSLLSMYHQFVVPDLTLFLDVSIETAIKRLSKADKTKEIYERKDALEKVSKGYRWLIKKFPEEITVVDGEGSIEAVQKELLALVNK